MTSTWREHLFPPRLAERLVRCVAGLAMFATGIAMFITADLGVAPWDVLHLGLSTKLGLSVGVVIEVVGLLLLVLWIPLRLRPGLGTILNALEIGLVVDLIGDHLPHTDRLIPRLLYVAGAVVVIAVGSGLYIGAGLGPGPRDGLMMGLNQRGVSIRVARTVIEMAVMVGGILLGGKVGVGTAAFMFGIGPLVHYTIPMLRMRGTPVPAAAH